MEKHLSTAIMRMVEKTDTLSQSGIPELAKLMAGYTNGKATVSAHKTAVVFESRALSELADLIPFGEKSLRSHRYTPLGKLREASVMDESF